VPARKPVELRDLVRPPLRSVEPYDPGPSLTELRARYGVEKLAKLNWNEDLFGLLPGVREAIIAEIARVHFYPEQAYSDFRELVATRTGAKPEMILPAHGIQALVLAMVSTFVSPGERVVLPQPTYGLYRMACEAAGAEIVRVPTRGHRLNLDRMLEAARGAKLVFVCDPNNPTGDALTPAEWSAFRDALPDGCVAVVDEAYADYIAAEDRPVRIADVEAGRPVVVLRTFSKLYGIAGLRLGYAIAHPTLIPSVDAVQEPFNVNRLALAAGTACLADPVAVEKRRLEVVGARESFAAALAEVGIGSWRSQANFLLAEVGGDDQAWYEALLRRGYLVRRGSEYGLRGHVRITIAPSDVMAGAALAMSDVSEELSALHQ
jgi:histidinol-phosphate aminotransferase